MRNHLRLPALAIVAILVVGACSSGTASTAPSAADAVGRPRRRRPAPQRRARRPRRPRRAPGGRRRHRSPPRPAPRAPTPNAMQMWERSGGNKGMVDILVCAWNAANPTEADQPELHRPHARWWPRSPRAIASGDVPDLMGMDLIYAPQFENAGQLVDITDQIKDWPELNDGEPGPHDRRDLQRPPLRRAAVRRRLGAVLQQGPVQEGRARPEQAADQPRRDPRRTPTRSPRSAATSRATTCRATAPAATSSPSAR